MITNDRCGGLLLPNKQLRALRACRLQRPIRCGEPPRDFGRVVRSGRRRGLRAIARSCRRARRLLRRCRLQCPIGCNQLPRELGRIVSFGTAGGAAAGYA